MPYYTRLLGREFRPRFKSIVDDINDRKNKDFFRPTGTQIYSGVQGSGKTISAVSHVLLLKERYPRSILVSNLSLTGLAPLSFGSKGELDATLRHIKPDAEYILFHDAEELAIALNAVNNDMFGVMYLIDEMHIYFNSLNSSNIPMSIFVEISQQRKQRKCIIGTSQLFTRVAKPLREQCDNIIVCNTFAGFLTVQKAYEGATLDIDSNGRLVGSHRRTGWFFHTPGRRNAYDTYQKVVTGQDFYDYSQPIDINISQAKNKFSLMGQKR